VPNHVHGIIRLTHPANGSLVAKHLHRAQHAAPLRQDGSAAPEDVRRTSAIVADSISAIVRSFKSAAAKRIREALGKPQFQVWQRGYYEHVIGDGDDFRNTCEYIRLNSARWEFDEENS